MWPLARQLVGVWEALGQQGAPLQFGSQPDGPAVRGEHRSGQQGLDGRGRCL